MVKLSATSLLVASGGLALSVIAGASVASAEPDVSPIINSTCSYDQVMYALDEQRPDLAAQVYANPIAQAWLRQLVASPADQRVEMVQQAQAVPGVQELEQPIMNVAKTCNNY